MAARGARCAALVQRRARATAPALVSRAAAPSVAHRAFCGIRRTYVAHRLLMQRPRLARGVTTRATCAQDGTAAASGGVEPDLAMHSTPLGGVFDACPAGDGPLQVAAGSSPATRWSLTPDQVAHYETHGYVTGVDVLSSGEVDALLADYATFLDPDVPPSPLWHEFHRNESSESCVAFVMGATVACVLGRGVT